MFDDNEALKETCYNSISLVMIYVNGGQMLFDERQYREFRSVAADYGG